MNNNNVNKFHNLVQTTEFCLPGKLLLNIIFSFHKKNHLNILTLASLLDLLSHILKIENVVIP